MPFVVIVLKRTWIFIPKCPGPEVSRLRLRTIIDRQLSEASAAASSDPIFVFGEARRI
jgi:hypothetical protein